MPFAVENADSVTVAVDPTGGIPWSMVGQPNGVAGLDETGKVPESQLELDFDPSGSAAAVQRQLETHTGNRNNPHGVTAAQVGAFTKVQTLTAGTAALVGLGADAVPDAVFAKMISLIDAANANANSRTKIKLVSYIGNDVTGADHAITLSADFPIQAAIWLAPRLESPYRAFINVTALPTSYGVQNGFSGGAEPRDASNMKRGEDYKSISWYSTDVYGMLNASSQTYSILLIG